jgi:hypothetical protein
MCNFIFSIALAAAAGYIGYHIGKAAGYEEAMAGVRRGR